MRVLLVQTAPPSGHQGYYSRAGFPFYGSLLEGKLKKMFTHLFIYLQQWGGLSLEVKTRIFIFCAFVELCGKLILFDKLNPTCRFNRTSCFLYWFLSRVVYGLFTDWSLQTTIVHYSAVPTRLDSSSSSLNDRSWHSH